MFGDIGKIMKMASEFKTRMPEVQQQLENSAFTAEAGGGVVSATVNGKMSLLDVKIDKSAIEDGDVEMLEDLIKAAISAAQAKAAEAAKAAMEEITGGMSIGGLEGLLG